jgi:hypothetical protein
VILKLREVFRNERRETTLKELVSLHADIRKLAVLIEHEQGSLVGRQAFQDLVVGAQKIAKRQGLISILRSATTGAARSVNVERGNPT